MPPARSTADDLFLRNMAALWRADARLAFLIDQLDPDAMLPVEPTRAGPPTARVRLADGRQLYLHSRHDPRAEAAQFCRTLPQDGALTGAVLLCGLGLGYHVAPLRERLGDEGVVIVSEPDPLTIKTALECTDLSEAIRARRLVFLHAIDRSDLHAKLEPHAGSLMLGTQIAAPPLSRQHHAEFHQRIREAVTEFAAYTKLSLMTLMANARVTCANIANNLAAYLSTPTIESLHNLGVGRSAVIVAAGPSLGRNIEQLRQVAPHAPEGRERPAAARPIIIALQTTLKPLLARGIRPDFVTSLDFSDLSKRFFEGVDLAGITLVAEPKASWHVIDAFLGCAPGAAIRPPRDLRLLYNDFAHRCLGDPLGQRPGLRAGSTVAHLAFYLAEYLGCDPIIFIGQDLGFSGGVYYTPGVAIHDAWRPELGTFCTLEMKEWERIARMRPILQRATDVHGRPIFTDEQMSSYRQQFERDFAASAARVVDATEGGVPKAGATVMPLADALRLDPRRPPVGPAAGPASVAPTAEIAARLRAGCDALQQRLAELSEFRGLCEETQRLLAEMVDLVESPLEFNRRIVRVDELRVMVMQRGGIFRMVSDVSQLAEWQKFAADRRLSAETGRAGKLSAIDRARRQLARDREFVAALLDGCDAMQRILRDALGRAQAHRDRIAQEAAACG